MNTSRDEALRLLSPLRADLARACPDAPYSAEWGNSWSVELRRVRIQALQPLC
ncbi:MAG TPA: hypothetical protein VHL09_02455 [Dehalococcoidia bacterium]|nr:hypothetical protein [Dehalococcoidia bacterium]